MRPWRGPKTLVWSRAADDPQRHDNLMLFGREFLAYTDFGRTSTARDTIERPPAVPSLGNDYSAGPSRANHLSNPLNQSQAQSTRTPKPRVNLTQHDTTHFTPNLNPMMPIMMEAWVYGLSTVDVNKDHVSPNFVQGDNGFIFPPPSVFIPAQSDGGLKPRQLKLLHTYITYFDILLLRLSPRNSPSTILRGSWNLLLGPERSHLRPPTPGTASSSKEGDERNAKKRKVDKQTQRRISMITTLEKWTKAFDQESNLRNETLAWASEQLPKDRWPHDQVVERILYEVNEINFRWEFRMLDRKMLDPNVPHYAHEDLVTQCFPSSSFEGEGGSDHMSVTYMTAWRGLSNPNGILRRKYITALARVMAQWVQCPASIKLALDSQEADVDFLELERSCATFYCRSYFYYFARAPSVPHRTTIDPAIYVMP